MEQNGNEKETETQSKKSNSKIIKKKALILKIRKRMQEKRVIWRNLPFIQRTFIFDNLLRFL